MTLIALVFILLKTMFFELFPFPAHIEPVVPDFTAPKPQTRLDRHILGQVQTRGWYPVHVAPQGQEAGFSYSLGLYANYAYPEVVIVGMPPQVAQAFLQIVAVRAVQRERKLEMYTGYDGIAEGTQVAFVPVARRHFPAHFDYGAWFYESLGIQPSFVQMVWPDASGKFPWERGYDADYATVQPLLTQ